jgi:hypothetical protein
MRSVRQTTIKRLSVAAALTLASAGLAEACAPRPLCRRWSAGNHLAASFGFSLVGPSLKVTAPVVS